MCSIEQTNVKRDIKFVRSKAYTMKIEKPSCLFLDRGNINTVLIYESVVQIPPAKTAPSFREGIYGSSQSCSVKTSIVLFSDNLCSSCLFSSAFNTHGLVKWRVEDEETRQ